MKKHKNPFPSIESTNTKISKRESGTEYQQQKQQQQ